MDPEHNHGPSAFTRTVFLRHETTIIQDNPLAPWQQTKHQYLNVDEQMETGYPFHTEHLRGVFIF